ncbi:MAG: ABC transporter permease [Thermoplasmata archaeon]
MKARRTFAITRKVFLGFVHDRRTLLFVLFQPILVMVLFGYTFGADPENLPVDVVNADEGVDIGASTSHIVKVSNNITNNLKEGSTLEVREWKITSWTYDCAITNSGGKAKITLSGGTHNLTQGELVHLFGFNNISYNRRGVVSTVIDPSSFVCDINYTADDTGTVLITDTAQVLEQAKQRVKDGKSWCVFFFPANFSENARDSAMGEKEKSVNLTMELYLDASNVNIVAPIVKKVNDAILESIKELSLEFGRNNTGAIDIQKNYIYGSADTKFIDNFAPGMMGFALVIITIGLSILTFVQEKTNMTLDRLIASPITEAEIVLGNAMGFSVIAIAQSIITLSVAVLWFGVSINPVRIPLTLGILILLSLGHLGIGIFFSAYSQNEFQAVQLLPLVMFPSILLSGLFWPVESIPSFIRPLSYIVPLRWGIEALRDVMLRDWNILDVWLHILILAGFAVFSLGASILLLKYKRL